MNATGYHLVRRTPRLGEESNLDLRQLLTSYTELSDSMKVQVLVLARKVRTARLASA